MTQTLISLGRAALLASDPEAKVAATNALAAGLKNGLPLGEALVLPDNPGRPSKPEMVSPADVPRRRMGSLQGRFALMHAVAHIEFNAIDLAVDMVSRFAHDPRISDEQKRHFATDWIGVAEDEARHFGLVRNRLRDMGGDYGDLPAHNGLWDAAFGTRHLFEARLAIAPMVLEARGLDVTPAMIKKLRKVEDHDNADILQIILDDEVGHVAAGNKWFHIVAKKSGEDPETFFKYLIKKHFKGLLKPPFNLEARDNAGVPRSYYLNPAVQPS